MPLHMRVPKLKGFNNPFRVEYQAVNLDTVDATGLDEVSPAELHAKGLVHKGALVKVLGRGEISRAVTVRPTASRSRPRQRSRLRAVRLRPCRCPGGTVVRRPRATTSPTAERADPHRPADPGATPCCRACGTCSRSRISGTRSCSRCSCWRSTGSGAHIPVPGIDVGAAQAAPGAGRERRRARVPPAVLRRRHHPVRGVRARDHAVHHGLDHHADPGGGDPQARAVAAAGRGRPAQDHAVDPLPHDRHRDHAVHRPHLPVPEGRRRLQRRQPAPTPTSSPARPTPGASCSWWSRSPPAPPCSCGWASSSPSGASATACRC